MISLFQAIVVLVLLGLAALYYFKIRKSPEKPQEDDDIDPLEDLEPEPVEPVKTTPVVADEPDVNEEPEVVVISKPEPENEDEPVKPTPTTTPAQPLVPTTKPSGPVKPVVVKPVVVKPAVEPVKRKLTEQELSVFAGKIRKFFGPPRGDECRGEILTSMFSDFARPLEFDNKTITKMLDPRRDSFESTEDTWARDYGFVPPVLLKKYEKFLSFGGQRYIMQQCQRI